MQYIFLSVLAIYVSIEFDSSKPNNVTVISRIVTERWRHYQENRESYQP